MAFAIKGIGQKLSVKAATPYQIDASHASTPIFHVSYNGEKNPGEIGTIKHYSLDYRALRARSWQSYLENEITQDIINKYVLWIIGSGLKLQSEPVNDVLQMSGIDLNTQEFTKQTESLFRVYSKSKLSDYANQNNLHRIASTTLLNAIIGGDVLVIQRFVKGNLNVQLVDGNHVMTPLFTDDIKKAGKRGNTIINGIELDKRGNHIAYYVRENLRAFRRIPARGTKSGGLMAYLVYGSRYRLDNHRGIPLISAVLETLKKLDRYKEATVGAAEERQKIPFYVEHDSTSTGENPLAKEMGKAAGLQKTATTNSFDDSKLLTQNIALTTGKSVWNMPTGSTLKALESKNELFFKDFYNTNVNMICAAIGIPPEVALSKYDSNFSASRAALKDWEHTINVRREDMTFQFYQPFYDNWLKTEILKGTISAEGYTSALFKGNEIVLESFNNARFVGANVPHIDPLKEVMAEREKLGPDGARIPLTTAEAATEALNSGDFDQNLARFNQEVQLLQDDPNKEEPKPNTGGNE